MGRRPGPPWPVPKRPLISLRMRTLVSGSWLQLPHRLPGGMKGEASGGLFDNFSFHPAHHCVHINNPSAPPLPHSAMLSSEAVGPIRSSDTLSTIQRQLSPTGPPQEGRRGSNAGPEDHLKRGKEAHCGRSGKHRLHTWPTWKQPMSTAAEEGGGSQGTPLWHREAGISRRSLSRLARRCCCRDRQSLTTLW